MLRNIILGLLALFAFSSNAQVNICLGDDETLCLGTQFTLQDCSSGGGSSGNFIQLQNPQSYTLGDDDFTSVINIGFNFEFYGNTYNQVIAGDNGIVSFNVSQAGGYCSWVATTLPSTTASALNSILIPWQDLFMPAGGTIFAETIGTAPNRQFVLFYDGLSLYSSACQTPDQCFTGSLILYEGSNKIETHISNKTTCASWGSGTAAHGLNNIDGTIGHFVPGRNNTVWTAQNDGWEFVPSGPNNYTLNPIPFMTVASPSGSGLVWGDTQGNSYPYNGGTLTSIVIPGTTGYFLSSATCGSGVGSVSDTTWITAATSQVNATATDDICSAGLGSVTATPLAGVPPYTYNWPTLGSTNQTVNGVTSGNYQVQMVDGMGCASSATVNVGDTPASFQGTTTVVSCPGGSDGTATAEMTPVLGNITYQWDAAAGNQTTQTATGLSAGQYTCTITSDIGCTGTVVVDVTEIPGMIGTISSQSDVTCNSGNNGVIEVSVSLGTAPYTYSWDNSLSTTNVANDLYAGTHTVTVTDANGCTIDVAGTIGEPAPLAIASLTPDTQICPEDDIMLSVSGTGGSSPYTFTWFENGTEIGTGTTITVDPENTNTQYCVELSEACGSPTDQECNLIYFPTPIAPSAVPDESEKCLPGEFIFTNTSSNSGEVATTFWEFGNELWALENGADTTSHTYNQVGTYDITMTVTSIYGCVYTDTLFSLVEVKPNPTADFTFSSNPTTIFNTTVQMQNASSVDAIYFDWYSPFSNPAFSNSQDPWLTFPSELGTYPVTLIVETERGCIDTTTLELNIVDDIIIYAPNTFTPDNDEFNQTWRIHILGIDIFNFELLIYNRWGELIWENHDPEASWDGHYNGMPVQEGTYTWIARVKSLYDDNKVTFNGSINVIR